MTSPPTSRPYETNPWMEPSDKPSASERRDEMAWDYCTNDHRDDGHERDMRMFRAGYDAAVKEMLRGNLQILGFSVEQIEQLKSFFEMQTAMKVNEYGGSLIDNLVKDNAALTKKVSELKAERDAHFEIEKTVLASLKQERDELRSGIDAFKYAADQNSIATNAWKLQAEQLAEALEYRKWHDDDCADRNEVFQLSEVCECGAEAAKQALAAFMDFREGK